MTRPHLYVAASLCLLTIILDGVLTYIGIEVLRVDTEGNPILHYLMQHFGVATTLIVTKVLGALGLYFIVRVTEDHPERIPATCSLLVITSAFYLCVAVIPWAMAIGL